MKVNGVIGAIGRDIVGIKAFDQVIGAGDVTFLPGSAE